MTGSHKLETRQFACMVHLPIRCKVCCLSTTEPLHLVFLPTSSLPLNLEAMEQPGKIAERGLAEQMKDDNP